MCAFVYIYISTYICIYNRNDPKLCYLKFHAMEVDFQAILKLPDRSNTLILDKVWHIAIGTNCHLSFTNYPVGFLYN